MLTGDLAVQESAVASMELARIFLLTERPMSKQPEQEAEPESAVALPEKEVTFP